MSLESQDDLVRIKQVLKGAVQSPKKRKIITKERLCSSFLLSMRVNPSSTKRIALNGYIRRCKEINKKDVISETQQRLVECPICMDYLVNPVQTQCGHTFCEICLTEALLKQNICPMCKKPIQNFNFKGDDLLNQIVQQCALKGCPDLYQKYIMRIKKFKLWNAKRRLHQFNVGSKIDLRDLSNVWCQATIKRIENQNSSPLLVVHYEGWSSIYDEVIPSDSNRISSNGFFTNRTDIPHYNLNNRPPQEGNSNEGEGVLQGILVAGGRGLSNLEGDIHQPDDEVIEINEAEQLASQDENEKSNQQQTQRENICKSLFQQFFRVSLDEVIKSKLQQ